MITLTKAVRALYWQRRDLPGAIALGLAAIGRGIAGSDEDRGVAKAIAFDIASFTWPGWDEPGIAIDATALRIGLDCARLNLRLAVELNRGPLPMSRAHWVLGAQLLAADDRDAARAEFARAAELAEEAGEPSAAALSRGYAALASGEPIDGEAASLDDGLAQQLRTAARVYDNG